MFLLRCAKNYLNTMVDKSLRFYTLHSVLYAAITVARLYKLHRSICAFFFYPD
jgi:hypothetical protein